MGESQEHVGDLQDPSLFVNRELSWLAFNERVLDQAREHHFPPLERLKFVSIFASNLDEFFMIRVSGLHEQLEADASVVGPDGLGVVEQLVAIRDIVQRHVARAYDLLWHDLLPILAEHRIHLRRFDELSRAQQAWSTTYFRQSVFPVLTPLAVDPVHPFPFLSNLSLSLAVEAEDPATLERKFARLKVPESLPRFVPLGDATSGRTTAEGALEFVALEELIAANMAELFPGMTILGWHPFRVTRDMDIEILEDEASDLLAIVDREVRLRRFGAAVRLEVAPGVPGHIRALLLEKLAIEEDDLYEAPAPFLGLSAFFALSQLSRPELRDAPLIQRTPLPTADCPDIFAAIRAGDVLLHHPYDSFGPVLELLRTAADDPQVLGIKMTLYRAGANSEAIRSLILAAENGKQIAVSIELKARFDEANNIGWARALERAGVHVFYGAAGLKTHAKVLLVVRREGHGFRRYVHLSTGNYNAATAKVYTDIGLFTADPAIGEDASDLFNALSGFSRKTNYQRLAVAPVNLRETLLAKIDAQTARAQAGRPAHIFAKLNALVDTQVIAALYRASSAGVTVDLIVRGICCLRPGVAGISAGIRVRSLIGRFLEHERVFVFGPKGEQEFFLSSADWMPRNLDRRVEVLFPVTAEALRDQIRAECLAPVDADRARLYEMRSDGVYHQQQPVDGEPTVDAQTLVMSTAGNVLKKMSGALP